MRRLVVLAAFLAIDLAGLTAGWLLIQWLGER